MRRMAIVKAKYTMKSGAAKASIRYIQHRPGQEGSRIVRELFGSDGAMQREEAYGMIDKAEKGSIFFRFVISPDPKAEDTQRDLHLRELAEKTMQTLEERVEKPVSWVGAEHSDHAPHRHVHVVAVVPQRLQVDDFRALRESATGAAHEQRQELDLAAQAQQSKQEAGLGLARQKQ